MEVFLPKGIEAMAGIYATKSDDVGGALFGPQHARLFASLADQASTTGFDDTRADQVTPGAELSVTHLPEVAQKVAESGFNVLNGVDFGSLFACVSDDAFGAVGVEDFPRVVAAAVDAFNVCLAHEGFDGDLQVFHGVVKIHDLGGIGEVAMAEVNVR